MNVGEHNSPTRGTGTVRVIVPTTESQQKDPTMEKVVRIAVHAFNVRVMNPRGVLSRVAVMVGRTTIVGRRTIVTTNIDPITASITTGSKRVVTVPVVRRVTISVPKVISNRVAMVSNVKEAIVGKRATIGEVMETVSIAPSVLGQPIIIRMQNIA